MRHVLVPIVFAFACTVAHADVQAPVLKWAYGGCFSSWCQTGWYSSPAAIDVDGDGKLDVVAGSYDVVALRGTDGAELWRGASDDRVWPGIAIGDLDGDGRPAIVVGRSGPSVTAYNLDGSVRWTATPFANGEVRSLALGDLDHDGKLSVVVGDAASVSSNQINVLMPNGHVRAGWPARRPADPGYGAGMYNENLAVADMDGDGFPEIYAPTDTHYVTALDRNGNERRANAMYGTSSDGSGPKVWAEVGVNVDQAADLRGYTECDTERRPNFASSAPAIADMDGDGVPELVLPGNVYDCSTDPYTDLYYDVWLLRADRTRWAGAGFDWTVIPAQGASGAPLSEDYDVIQNIAANAVVADLDQDGQQEILLPSYDGKLHAWWLDKTEHGAWPFVIPGAGFHFASEPVIADLDGDGSPEVLFASWGENDNGQSGKLFVLNALGQQLFAVDLPAPRGGTWSGGLAAPTLADIDGDGELEAIVDTVDAGVVAFDLPGTEGAHTLWPTGRGSYLRAGVAARGDRIFADGFGG
ncbi:MAG TPA: VCBS repeat-containing protein [Rhodanobacteraceae bacterium]|nr:VCBS repeat-containing protein [Rhodanobacteraceae bacterium]